jgi:hypothetical protein
LTARRPDAIIRGPQQEGVMNPILSAGIVIGVLCTVWMFVMGFTGWYRDPAHAGAFFLVILIEIGGLVWGLRRTAAEGRAYGSQVVAGTLMAVVAGVIIIAASLIFTTVAFPNYFEEIAAGQRQVLEAQGRPTAEIEEAVRGTLETTPISQAMTGFIGTLITGIVASAVIALFVRARSGPAARA